MSAYLIILRLPTISIYLIDLSNPQGSSAGFSWLTLWWLPPLPDPVVFEEDSDEDTVAQHWQYNSCDRIKE